MKKYTTIIFDLDGTLMNTLTDLCNSVNYTLHCLDLPKRTIDEVRVFVGNGVKQLMIKSLQAAVGKESLTDELISQAMDIFHKYYVAHCQDTTKPYDGIYEMLDTLKNSGYKIAIVSNKPQRGVEILTKQFFEKYINVALGEDEVNGIHKKPAPDMVYKAIEKLGEKPEDCVYIGDSEVDLQTAQNAKIDCISVLWGFRDKELLLEYGAKCFAQNPNDVLKMV